MLLKNLYEFNNHDKSYDYRSKKWTDYKGNNYTSEDIVDMLSNRVGAYYSVKDLEETFPVGATIDVLGDLEIQRTGE